MVTLESEPKPYYATPEQMKDGQIGVLSGSNKVVQKLCKKFSVSKDCLQTIGAPVGDSWSEPFPPLRIRLLEPGEKIVVGEN